MRCGSSGLLIRQMLHHIMAMAEAPSHIWLCSSQRIWNFSSIGRIPFPPDSGVCWVLYISCTSSVPFLQPLLYSPYSISVTYGINLPQFSHRHRTWFLLECLWLWWDKRTEILHSTSPLFGDRMKIKNVFSAIWRHFPFKCVFSGILSKM